MLSWQAEAESQAAVLQTSACISGTLSVHMFATHSLQRQMPLHDEHASRAFVNSKHEKRLHKLG